MSNVARKIALILVTAPPPGETADDAALTKIDGRESVLRVMELFGNRDGVSQSLLLIDPAKAELYKQKVGSHLSFIGVKLLQGGKTWVEQMAAAREKLAADVTHVLVHDAARPAVPYSDLDALLSFDPAAEVVACTAKVKGLLADYAALPGFGTRIERNLATLSTPIRFTRAAFDAACAAGKLPTDFQLINGSPLNVRCGTCDAAFVKAMVQLLPKPKVQAPLSPFEEAQW